MPADNVQAATISQATEIAHTLLEHWSYVGVLSIELFDEGGKLRVNELAPGYTTAVTGLRTRA